MELGGIEAGLREAAPYSDIVTPLEVIDVVTGISLEATSVAFADSSLEAVQSTEFVSPSPGGMLVSTV